MNTSAGFGGECHLDATMVRSGLGRLGLDHLDLLVIENVGNLVCPAEFDVGEDAKAMVYAVTEGEEKPLKYPVMFRTVEVVVVNKVDLLPHLDFDVDRFLGYLHDVNPRATVIQASARTGQGVAEWCEWLLDAMNRRHASTDAHMHEHSHHHGASARRARPRRRVGSRGSGHMSSARDNLGPWTEHGPWTLDRGPWDPPVRMCRSGRVV